MIALKTMERAGVAPVISPNRSVRNRLLRTLTPRDMQEFQLRPDIVQLRRGTVLFEADESVRRVYFPTSGIVSLANLGENGTSVEMAAIGREGFIGIESLFGGPSASYGAYLVQVAGSALTFETANFREAMQHHANFCAACRNYMRAFLAQLFHNVACNALHGADARCARWLLMAHDRSDGDTFQLTQEFLAEILGLRRATVTVAAQSLQARGLIHYRRGALTVLDRPGLEAAACGCYRSMRSRYEQVLPQAFD